MSQTEKQSLTAPTPSGEAVEPLTADWFRRCVVFNAERKEITLSFGALVDEVERLHAALLAARRERDALRDALRDVVDAYDWWQVDSVDREAPAEAIQAARAALAATPEEKTNA